MSETLDAAVDAAMQAEAEYSRTRKPDGRGWGMPPRDQVERLVAGALPVIVPAIRKMFAAEINPAKLLTLANWFDVDDAAKGKTGSEVQQDLRRWALILLGDDRREGVADALAHWDAAIEAAPAEGPTP
jgi:hypothetical protein